MAQNKLPFAMRNAMTNSLMINVGNTPIDTSLDSISLGSVARVHWNLPPAKLILQTLLRGEGVLTPQGALSISTGSFTGRSPKDRFIVQDDHTLSEVDWGSVNQPMSMEHFDLLHQDMVTFLEAKSVFVRDAAVGADRVTQI